MLDPAILKSRFEKSLKNINTLQLSGRVTQVIGLIIESEGPKAPIGEVCKLLDRNGNIHSLVEIVGFRDNKILSIVLGSATNITPGMEIVATGNTLTVSVGDGLLGRILDGLGEPIDDMGPLLTTEKRSIYSDPPNPLFRQRIHEPLATGIRAIDGLITIGKGQRMGIFAGSGIGKSTLLGMIARNTSADINVIALIGERGREVREFIEKDLGEEGLRRSIVVVATSDSPALVRVKSALVATTIAEYFRDKSLDVMLMMDSSTRLAMAQREVGLSIGEPPTSRGYTPSVFSILQKTLERAGTSENGSVTGLYTVLVEGDDMNEPIADACRGILDGHIVLSRRLATQGHYPAIDVLESISRVRNDVIDKEHKTTAIKLLDTLATYRNAEDLISVGAYQKGTNPQIDNAVVLNPVINDFLKQQIDESINYNDTIDRLKKIVK